MKAQLVKISLLLWVMMTLLCGVVYPLFVTGVSGLAFPGQSGGSLVMNDRGIAGSNLIGQAFTRPEYFHGRPSATDPAYNASGSGASNLGPSNAGLIKKAAERVAEVRKLEKLPDGEKIPADMVTSSASGLDPHISVEAAKLQARRVAQERSMKIVDLQRLVSENTEEPFLGFWGGARVNVLKLNMELDRRSHGQGR
jgi:K+-transporting ATPase ATPase C chain